MPLPPSFLKAGFGPPPKKLRRLMIGTEGEPGSGKTEFIASAPGPGIIACIDRNYEAMLDNPHPPESRRDDFAYKVINIKLESQGTQAEYLTSWNEFKKCMYDACAIPECRTIGIDTDNVSWDLQMLAEFGKIAQVPQLMRAGANTARRAFIARLSDSGKNIIATNMLKDEWEDVVDEVTGKVQLDSQGKKKQVKTGERKRQGFPDQSYLWQVQIRHLFKPAEMVKGEPRTIKMGTKEIQVPGKMEKVPPQFGIRILKCTRNSEMVGEELWGNSCNFKGLVQLIYPDVKLSEWGY